MATHSRPLSTLNATDLVNVIAFTIAGVQLRLYQVVLAVLVSITASIECTTMDARYILLFLVLCLDAKSFTTNYYSNLDKHQDRDW